MKNGKIIIAIWTYDKLKGHIDNKYNSNGFFICVKEKNVYTKICFGKPFDFNTFVIHLIIGNIIFDSGMYEGNNRNYSHFRSTAKKFWNLLITDEFE